MKLTTRLHDRDAAGMTYVYPVVSRRAGGVSVGINLNPNNACNWRCVYCQVPGLVRGRAPEVDLELLERELSQMLEAIVGGDFMERHVPESARRLNDVAFSGNGEPTLSPRFGEAIALVGRVLERFDLAGRIKVILITNGSRIHLPAVRRALSDMAALNGEVWFKVDSATDAGMARINDVATGVQRARKNLLLAAAACPTWIQTMLFARAGEPPSEEEQAAYLAFLADARAAGAALRGVLLYGLARPSHQPEAAELAPLPAAWMEAFARRVQGLGIEVRTFL